MDKMLFSNTSRIFGITPQLSGALYQELITWVQSSGQEWTVKRLKSLKLILLESVEPGSRILRGSWGSLVTNKNISFENKMNMLNVYHYFTADMPTESQLDKFYSSMTSEDTTGTTIRPTKTTMRKVLGRRVWKPYPKPYFLSSTNPQKRIPFLSLNKDSGTYDVGSVPEDEKSFWSDAVMAYNSPIWRLYENHGGSDINYLSPEEETMIAFAGDPDFAEAEGWMINPEDCVGKIGFIQEPGFKLRAVANPVRFAQHALDPLKDTFLHRLRNLPEDCTFDQEKGVRWAQTQLKQGKTLYSIDLSDATNLFPWNYQSSLVHQIVDDLPFGSEQRFAALFLERLLNLMVKSKWACPDGQSRKFTRGQPLGLGPSFPLFALAHHCVLKNIPGSQGQYMLLGDDIVISNTSVAQKYMSDMKLLGAQISLEKSLTSNKMAEFAGKIITKHNVMSKYKWLPIRKTNVMDILRVHGPKLLSLVPRALLDVVPTLCVLPRYLGGCGFVLPSPYNEMVDHRLIQAVKDKPELIIGFTWIPKVDRYRSIIEQLSIESEAENFYHDLIERYDKSLSGPHGFVKMHRASTLPKDQEKYYIRIGSSDPHSSRTLVSTARKLRVLLDPQSQS